ncbi:hypothetical protein QOZ80_1AG0024490 [Eleusine coracana subsp. coracana]|nr:hypothetical protein QOZ80_1AG0024490 [Eleusine coracana subsp. coracana]
MRSEKRPPGRKQQKEKLKKGVESIYKESLDNMIASRKEVAADMKDFKLAKWADLKEMEERRMMAEERRSAAEERRSMAEERRATAEERRATAEEQRAAVEERRIAVQEAVKRLEQEQRIMLMDPSKLDEKGRAYYELSCYQIMTSRSMVFTGGFMGGCGGFVPNGTSGGGTSG